VNRDAPVGRWTSLVPGLVLATVLGAAAIGIAEIPWVRDTLHWSALLIVILLGMAWRSLLPVPESAWPGIRTAQRAVLRWGVAGLGFRLSIGQIAEIGAPALLVVVVGTVSALFFGWWVAKRMGVAEDLGILLGVGGAICGASAIVAADTVVQGERRSSAIALGVVTLLGTIGIVVYPAVQRALGIDPFVYGVWAGASLQETAHVVAAGFGVGEEAVRVATVAKLARIALLAPIVLYLAWSLRRRRRRLGEPHVSAVPWFLVAFVLFAAIHSTGWIPAAVVDVIRRIDLVLLCVGMAGVGLQTGLADLKSAGARPIAVGALQWAFLAATTLALATWLCR
jgi:uncharacterized integral membrane protein (TIGR00698 family)